MCKMCCSLCGFNWVEQSDCIDRERNPIRTRTTVPPPVTKSNLPKFTNTHTQMHKYTNTQKNKYTNIFIDRKEPNTNLHHSSTLPPQLNEIVKIILKILLSPKIALQSFCSILWVVNAGPPDAFDT